MRLARSILILAVALVALLLPSLASADGMTWTLDNVSFAGGASATGFFNFDSVSNLYSAVNVATTAGGPFVDSSYTTLTDAVFDTPTVIGLGPNPFLDFGGGNLTGATVLELFFLNPLTNAGGTDPVFAVEFLCNNSTCSNPFTRESTSGTVSSQPISTPEPSSFLFLAAGLLSLALFRRLA